MFGIHVILYDSKADFILFGSHVIPYGNKIYYFYLANSIPFGSHVIPYSGKTSNYMVDYYIICSKQGILGILL